MSIFNPSYLDRLSTLIAERTGLNTFENRRERLLEILTQSVEDPSAYLKRLEIHSDEHKVWQDLLAELTVGETYFMRDERQIAALREVILPSIIQEKRSRGLRTINIWSAGCATGEEAYTLAMLLIHLLPDRHVWHVDILGTDINETAIQVARTGHYSEWSFRTTPTHIREHYFEPIPHRSPPLYSVHPEIRAMVRFAHDNLMQPRALLKTQDLVVCRNVLIYFTAEQIQRLEKNLSQYVQAGGWLMLSPAEVLQTTRREYEVQHMNQTLAYRKKGGDQLSVTITKPNWPPRQQKKQPQDTPTNEFQRLYQEAVHLMQSGRIDDAKVVAENAQQQIHMWHIKDHEYIALLDTLLASIWASKGDYEQAHDYLLKALHTSVLHAEAHYLMGLLQMERGDYESARTSLRAAIFCKSDFALAYLLSGDLFAQTSELERAQRSWINARRFASDFPTEHYLSDIADLTAGQLIQLVDDRLSS